MMDAATAPAPTIRTRTRQQRELTPPETLRQIEKYIANPPESSVVMTITPEMASAILDKYNLGNRSKKPGKIDSYALDINDNKWLVTGDTIKFSNRGLLRDGQNRLLACARAGKPFRTHVVFGVDDAAFSKMDQGRNRSGGDVLQIAGYKDTNSLSAAVRWTHLLENGRVKQRDTLSPDEILHLVQERYQALPDFLQQAGRIYSTTGQPKGVVAALLYMFYKKSPSKYAEWAMAWEKGQDGGKFRSMSVATKRIQEIKSASFGRVHDAVRAALLVKAWNMYVTGTRPKKDDMNWTLQMDFPEILGDGSRVGRRKAEEEPAEMEDA